MQQMTEVEQQLHKQSQRVEISHFEQIHLTELDLGFCVGIHYQMEVEPPIQTVSRLL
jgi:hypothetical protein